MNKFIKMTAAIGAAACLTVSLAGCNLLSQIKENARLASETTLADTPAGDDEALSLLETHLDAAFSDCESIKENVSYSAGGVNITKAGTEDKAGLLSDAANTVKKMIMSAKPGAAEREITSRDDAGLLAALDGATAVTFEYTRNTEAVNITDEEGSAVTNEEGENETEIVNADNALNYNFRYYEEPATAEEGEDVTIVSDAAVVEAVFGEKADKAAVISAFDCVKDFIVLSDYDISYGKCEITATVDMETGEITSANFVKTMNVTATVNGVGSLADYGEMTVVTEITKTVSYNFTYTVPEE